VRERSLTFRLPYGRVPYPLDLRGRSATLLELPDPGEPRSVRELLDAALDAPIGAPRLETLVGAGARVTVIISDTTREEPRAEFLAALRERLPDVRWTVAIATGTHGPADVDALALPPALVRDARVVNHDGHRRDDLVELGETSRGTPVRVHRCVVDADLVIATGCIRPHYFAGFGAGTKAIFPGLGEAHAIRINHRLKTAPGSVAGCVDDNPCRLDLEEAARLVPTTKFVLDGISAADGRVHGAVAGDPFVAFRVGADQCRAWFTVRAPRAQLVIASDALPVSASLYQAAKIAAAVAPLVDDGGTLLVVAECAEGIEPLETVNEAIFRIGVLPRLAPGVSLRLLSSLPAATVERTLLEPVSSVAEILDRVTGSILVAPHASHLLAEVVS